VELEEKVKSIQITNSLFQHFVSECSNKKKKRFNLVGCTFFISMTYDRRESFTVFFKAK